MIEKMIELGRGNWSMTSAEKRAQKKERTNKWMNFQEPKERIKEWKRVKQKETLNEIKEGNKVNDRKDQKNQ